MAELLTALTETEARLHVMEQVPDGGPLRFIRKWEYVDATYADDLLKVAPATVTNPYVDAQALVGTYRVTREWGEGQDDRSVTIFQRLTVYPNNISFYSEQTGLSDDRTYLYKDESQPVAAPVDSQGQIYKADNTINQDGTYDGRLTASLSAAANVQFKFKTSFFRDGTAWVYKNQRAKIEAPLLTGSGMYEVKQDMNRDLTYDTLLMYEGPNGNGMAAFISEQAGLSDEHTTIYKEWPTKIEAPPDSQGHIYQADNSITEMGAYNAQLRRIDSTADSFTKTTQDTYLVAESTITGRNATAAAAAASVAQGVIQFSQNQMNKDLTYDTVVRQHTSKESEIYFRSGVAQTTTADTYAYQNMRAMFHTGLSAAQGTMFRAAERMEPDGTYTGDVVKITSVPQKAIFYSDTTRLSSEETHLYKGIDSIPGSGDFPFVQAVAYRSEKSFNEDGTYDGRLLYRASFPQEVYTNWSTRGGLAWAYWMSNQPNARTDVSGLMTTSGTNSVSMGINQDLTYDIAAHHSPSGGANIFVADSYDYAIYPMQHRSKPGSNFYTQSRVLTWHIYAQFFSLASNASAFGAAVSPYDVDVKYWGSCDLWQGIYTVLENVGSWTDDA